MTTMRNFDEKCSVCGETSPQPVLTSTNSWGYPDLDLRPAPMQRDTMSVWLAECPHCGYVAGDLSDESGISIDFLKSDDYLTCEGHDFISDLSKRFYRRYMISKETNDTAYCFFNLRNCAWACDDGNDELASEMRRLALPYLEEMIKENGEDKNNILLIKADFLRRMGEFDRMIDEFKDLILGDLKLDEIIQFQIMKAQEKDTSCYTGEDVFGR